MKTGVIDSRGEFHELPFYEIQGLCEKVAQTAAELVPGHKYDLEDMGKEYTRFSKELEFCLHKLGWYLYDPFLEGKDQVLISNGERCYLCSMEFVKKEGFRRESITNTKIGFPALTDKNVGYDKTLNPDSVKTEGIVDAKGYVDSEFAGSLESLAEIELMHELIADKDAYEEYMKNRDMYENALSYLTSRENVIAAKKVGDKISLSYVSDNDGVVANFIEKLDVTDRLAELTPIVANTSRDVMVMK